MHVKIGPYLSWYGPYQIAELLMFWKDKDDDTVHNFGTWLAEDKDGNETWLAKLCQKIHDKRKRKVKIHIDKYDVWSMDDTLAMIILPMLYKLKDCKHGSAMVDLEDVPDSMRYTNTEDYSDQYTFDFYHNDAELNSQNIQCDLHNRWDWVMDEMIWAFEQLQPDYDWEDQYWKVKPEMGVEKDNDSGMREIKWKVNGECDWEGMRKHSDRINNGLKLFGKYYRGLWD